MFLPNVLKVAPSASAQRLQQLVEARVLPGADKAAIDRRIWDLFGERWAVMFTDLSGFSRRVAEFGIIQFLQTIHESVRLLTPCFEAHDGILLKVEADSLMIIFRRPQRALACAIAMQGILAEANRSLPPEEQILMGLGIGYGDMLRVGDEDVFGAEVNAASKLGEDIAKAGEILVTDQVRIALGLEARVGFEPLAEAPSGSAAEWRVVYRRP
jgi:class 3 adenylate cyclase